MSTSVKLDWGELVVGDFVLILMLLGSFRVCCAGPDYITSVIRCRYPS